MVSKTEQYSTWGTKILKHLDVLSALQNNICIPITVQLAPTEICDSNCVFCSVKNRPSGRIRWETLIQGLADFKILGAKSVEITGGGNPLLYKDSGKTILDIIDVAYELGYKIGIITNSEDISVLDSREQKIDWVRVSVSKLDEGILPKDYSFGKFQTKLGLSYIINKDTTEITIQNIAEIVSLHNGVKFVRIAPDCLADDSLYIKDKWEQIINKYHSMFIKDIGENYKPYKEGCWVGIIRPYWTSTGIYICTSHVLLNRDYDDDWKLCEASEIIQTWKTMGDNMKLGNAPYEININKCGNCYYFNNNSIIGNILTDIPDKDFA